MKLANSEIIGLLDTLGTIADKDIPVNFTYQLFDINQRLQESYAIYWNTLQSIMKKNEVDNPDDPKIEKEVRELLDMRVDVSIDMVKREELINSGIALTLQQLTNLSPIIEE